MPNCSAANGIVPIVSKQLGLRRFNYRRFLSSFLVLGAVVFVSMSLWNNYQQLNQTINELALLSLLLGSGPAVAMAFLKCQLNYLIIRNTVRRDIPGFMVLTSEFAKSQLVRYIPGMVWGIMYQANRLAQLLDPKLVWQAAIVQDLLANINTVLVLVAALAYFSLGWQVAIAVFLLLSLVLFFLIRTDALSQLYALIVNKFFRIEGSFNAWSDRESLRAVVVLHADWVAYFLLWIVILPTSFSWKEAIAVGVCYSLASLLGKLAFVVPSGLFVREAAFVWLGQHASIDVEILLLFGVLARILLTLSDVLFAILFLRFGRTVSTVNSSGMA